MYRYLKDFSNRKEGEETSNLHPSLAHNLVKRGIIEKVVDSSELEDKNGPSAKKNVPEIKEEAKKKASKKK